MVLEKFKKVLKSKSHFVTQERALLFDELRRLNAPCSIKYLIEKTDGYMDETTVYRNLEVFEELGITHRVYAGWKYNVELSDMFREHHHHMACTNCGTIISFEESDTIVKELKKLEQKYGFKSTSHSLELTGLCNSCC